MKNLTKKDLLYILICIFLFLGIMFALTNVTYLYGSQVDWYCQHTTIPEYFRTLFYENHHLFPDFAFNIGSGQNIYNFSYYGLLSPIILISYLLPFMSMQTFIIISTIITIIASTFMLYIFFKKKKYSSETCFITSLMFIMTSCIAYHSHRHIMFITYLPFLILGLFGVEKKLDSKKGWLLALSVFLLIMTSYYYSIGGIVVLAVYGIYKYLKDNNKVTPKDFIKTSISFIIPIIIGIVSAAIIILPTLACILYNRAASNVSIGLKDLIIPYINADYVVYNPYGVGLTAIIFPALIMFFNKKKENLFLGIVLSLLILFPLFNYILNGTMYIESKSLIPFLPLYTLVIANFVEELFAKKINYKLLIPSLLVIGLLSGLKDARFFAVIGDFVIMFIGIFLYKKYDKKIILIIFLSITPVIQSFASSYTDEFVSRKESKENETIIKDKIDYITSNDKSFYRISNDTDVSNNTNRIYQNMDYYNSTVYSSISNQKYNKFYFDVINNNISSRNRVLTITTGNIFSLLLTNNKYVVSGYKPLQGYELVKKEDGINIYKSENTLPLGFATNKTMSVDEFNKLNFAEQMEALLNVIVIDNKTSNDYMPTIEKANLDFDKVLKNDKVIKEKDNTYTIKAKDSLKIKYQLPEEYYNKILIIRFKMNHEQTCEEGDQAIIINNIKNKLTCKSWKYHNSNRVFDFVLAEKDLKELTITFQEGEYNIGDIESYVLDYQAIANIKNNVDELVIDKDQTKGDQIIGSINVKEDGYLMLTIPYDNGFTINVDGKKVDYELVDETFIGFKISKGKHNIEIYYEAPFKNISLVISSIGIVSFILMVIIEKIKNK